MATAIILYLAILAMDITALALTVAAANHPSTVIVVVNSDTTYRYCSYSSDVATGYGAGAMVLLAASQAAAMLATRCFCCGPAIQPGRWRAYSGICFLACWFTFLIAEICLLAASVRNAYHTRYMYNTSETSCSVARKGVFGAAAAFIVFTALLTFLHHLFYTRARDMPHPSAAKETGIHMTQI